MLSNCCPAASAVPTIPAVTCASRFGQIQKIIFQRIYKTAGVMNSITGITTGTATTGDATLLASWTVLKAKTDGEKIAVTPFIEEPADDGGDARTFGGGNDTLNGIELIIGSNPVNFTCRLNGKKQDIIAELKKLGREDIIVIAGGVIPAQDYDFLYQAGVAAIFGPGSPVSRSAWQILEILLGEE
mgnify:CR=1 FL=1